MVTHVHQQARYTTRRLRRYVVHGVSLDIAREYAYLIDLLDVHHLGGHFGFLLGGRLLEPQATLAMQTPHASSALITLLFIPFIIFRVYFTLGFRRHHYSASAVDASSSII